MILPLVYSFWWTLKPQAQYVFCPCYSKLLQSAIQPLEMQCGFHPSRATMDVILLQRKMQALQWITFHDIFLNLKTSLPPSIKINCVNSSKTWLSFEIPFHITFLECYATMILTDVSTIDPIPLQIDLNAVSFFSVQCCTLPRLPGGWSKFSEPFKLQNLSAVHLRWLLYMCMFSDRVPSHYWLLHWSLWENRPFTCAK